MMSGCRAFAAGMILLWVCVDGGGCTKNSDEADTTLEAQRKERTSQEAQEAQDTGDSRTLRLAKIRRLVSFADARAVRQAIAAHLIRFPDDVDAMLVAADFYERRGEVDSAIAMLEAAASRSPKRNNSLHLRAAKLLVRAERWDEAIERFELILATDPNFHAARHEWVASLNRLGFRFDANTHVRELCRHGEATAEELRGLVFPNRSATGFQTKPAAGDMVAIERLGPLNVARAFLSERDVVDASGTLRDSELIASRNPAAVAFYGRVLMEAQQFDQFAQWQRLTTDDCLRYPAYWVAVGDWAMRNRDFDAAVGMFAEAILREPGDLGANDRMTGALAAAGHADWSDRFRHRGVLIDRVNRLTVTALSERAVEPVVIDELCQLLNQIGRPLESLSWYRLVLSSQAASPAAQKMSQAMALLGDDEMQKAVRETLLCDINLQHFPRPSRLDNELDDPPVIAAMPNKQSIPIPHRPVFVDVAAEVGLNFRYAIASAPKSRYFLIHEQLGGGVACLDYDLDGHVDLYLGQAGFDPPDSDSKQPNQLSRLIDRRFIDVTDKAGCDDRGYTFGVTSGDWNQDGFPDLVVANLMQNSLLINQGDGTFIIHPACANNPDWNAPRFTASLAMGDVNGDDLPEIIEVNYLDDAKIFEPIEFGPDGAPLRLPAPLHFRPAADRVFVSNGDGSFRSETLEDADRPNAATGLGVLVTDVDGKPGNEIFIANDHLANHLWQFTGDKRGGREGRSKEHWRDTAGLRGVAWGADGTPMGCMGIAAADFDHNGRLDLHVTNFENEWSNHYMQATDGYFDDLIVASGLDQPSYRMVGFGVQAIDYDNNRWADLVIGQGHVEDHRHEGRMFAMPTEIFAFDGSQFKRQSVQGDNDYWNTNHLSRAIATLDWNRDGRLDFVATDLQQPLSLLENRTETSNHWLQLQLVGKGSERDAIGTVVTITAAGSTTTAVVQSGDGYLCKNQPMIHFGVGQSTTIESLDIRWPSGVNQRFESLEVDQCLQIVEGFDDLFVLSSPGASDAVVSGEDDTNDVTKPD